MQRKLYVVAYDVRKPGRLAKALSIVRAYASGGQKSAYECWLSESERQELMSRLSAVLDLAVDSIAFFPLDTRYPMTAMGVAVKPVDPDYYYIG